MVGGVEAAITRAGVDAANVASHRVNSGVFGAAIGRGGGQGTARPGSGEAKIGVKVEMGHHAIAESAEGGSIRIGGGLRIGLGGGGLHRRSKPPPQ